MAVSVLNRAKAQLVINEPFYATILLNLQVVETSVRPDGKPLWIAATNGAELFINPDSFEKLSVAEAKGVLKHEVMHIAQMHNWRGAGKEPERWNRACDYAINPIIMDEGGELPAGVLDGTQYKGMTAEQIYAQLPAMPPGSNNAQGMDDDIMPAKDPSQAGQDQAKIMISQAKQAATARGKMPEHMKSAIDEVFNPRVDWREELRQYLTEISPSDYSFSKCNRRFMTGDNPMYLPGMSGHDDMQAFGALMDTSMSISMVELQQGLGEIVGAVTDVNPKQLVVAYCDAAVQHHDVFDQPGAAEVAQSFARHGAGGTSMPAGLKWYKRNFPNVQAVMVWTDGFTDFGNEDDYPFPVIWAISEPSITAPWGRTIHVDIVG